MTWNLRRRPGPSMVLAAACTAVACSSTGPARPVPSAAVDSATAASTATESFAATDDWEATDAAVATDAAAATAVPRTSTPTSGGLFSALAGAAVLVVVGAPDAANASERQLVGHLHDLGATATVVADAAVAATDLSPYAVVVVSKTVTSTDVGTALNDVRGGVLLWEDNLQRRSLMALHDDDGEDGTAWHATGTTVHVRDDAPETLRAGTAGTTGWYDEPGEITYAPTPLVGATVVATLVEGDPRAAVYVVEAGTELADGTRAAGRRAYAGLYDDTFRLLTPDALGVFDALLHWTATPPA